ncbi:MAG: DUF1573 domain-containing protein [bacterium]|nr:DUF1573 domain-containing protein [bacterium]
MKYALFLLISFCCFQLSAVTHPDNGQELCFEYSNVDRGLKYQKDDDTAFFPFVNCSDRKIILDTVYSNKTSSHTIYRFYNPKKLKVIYPGQRDTLFFTKRELYSEVTGLFDNSFSIEFENSDVVQHLNIFCEIDFNYGKLTAEDVLLPTVNRGDSILFSGAFYNGGTDPVTINRPYRYGTNSQLDCLNEYPIKIMPGHTKELQFSLKTEHLLNQYEGSVAFETNEGSRRSYRSTKIDYSGRLISVGTPSIQFDSLTLHKFVDKSGDGRFEFFFENDGDEPLIIKWCKTSCGCLVASWPKEPIEPGERGVIKVRYDTKRIGPINKSITVSSNAPQEVVMLRVKGYVKNVDPQPGK